MKRKSRSQPSQSMNPTRKKLERHKHKIQSILLPPSLLPPRPSRTLLLAQGVMRLKIKSTYIYEDKLRTLAAPLNAQCTRNKQSTTTELVQPR